LAFSLLKSSLTNTKTLMTLGADMNAPERTETPPKQQKAITLARRIPLGKNTPEKANAVHQWVLAVKDMLKA
jgi:hypothetical protein